MSDTEPVSELNDQPYGTFPILDFSKHLVESCATYSIAAPMRDLTERPRLHAAAGLSFLIATCVSRHLSTHAPMRRNKLNQITWCALGSSGVLIGPPIVR